MTYSIPDVLSRYKAKVTTDSLLVFGGPARQTVYSRLGSERESISRPPLRPYSPTTDHTENRPRTTLSTALPLDDIEAPGMTAKA